ncbi:UNKNOWN [Stylonychia lemnae]|uniref:Uncharacterized protein n=1 Tax=Stylonychia lemnae TaxID=5949 RepID=A0A077ZXU9_STYLE|nr:UNKNOWN [Stylonychia lemnae]|eukprot:CDW74736.1 UNKNOWN [Stylonychia lemnae]
MKTQLYLTIIGTTLLFSNINAIKNKLYQQKKSQNLVESNEFDFDEDFDSKYMEDWFNSVEWGECPCDEVTTVSTTTQAPTTTYIPTTSAAPTSTEAPTTSVPETSTEAPTITSIPSTTEAPTTSVPETSTEAPTTSAPETSTVAPTTSAPETETTTEAPTTPPIPTSGGNPPNETCNATNTPNWRYNQEYDCNWVYNSDFDSWMCINENCEWSFNKNNCSWICINNETTPEGNNTVICNYTCEEFSQAFDRISMLENYYSLLVGNLADQLAQIQDMATQISDLNAALSSLQSSQQSIGSNLDDLSQRVTDLEDTDVSANVKQDIKDNGLFLGDRWWIGQQVGSLWAIDYLSPSFIKFPQGVNATIG